MKANLFMTMAAATMILAGCTNDENETIDNRNGEIRLSSGVTVQQTRANSDDVPDRQIADGQTVKVIVAKQSTDESVYTGYSLDFTADGNGGLSNATPMYYPASGKGVNIYAYHPADAAASFSVQEDQSTDENYYTSDLLYSAAKDYARQKEAHPLTFVHKLSKVEYTLTAGAGTPDLTGATVQWLNVSKTIGFTAATGAVATPADEATITPHATYGAIIVPQTVSGGTQLLKVTLASGGVLYYTPDAPQVFDSGKKYKYAITVNLSRLTVTSTVTDWGNGGINTGDAEMPPPIGSKTAADAAVGDFYMNDGSLVDKDDTPTAAQQAACIGIVYSTDINRIGEAAKQALADKGVSIPHGLVMALTNASNGCGWGNENIDENGNTGGNEPFQKNTVTLKDQYENVNGYGETQWMVNKIATGGYNAGTYKAFDVTSKYGTEESGTARYAAPDKTTGWFIPSMGQWWDILSNLGGVNLDEYKKNIDKHSIFIDGAATTAKKKMNDYLKKIPGATKFDPSRVDLFWSSSEYRGHTACNLIFYVDGRLALTFYPKSISANLVLVRCSLAF